MHTVLVMVKKSRIGNRDPAFPLKDDVVGLCFSNCNNGCDEHVIGPAISK